MAENNDLFVRENNAEHLSLLGSNSTNYPTKPEEAILEVIPNKWMENDYIINLDCHEFTCVCPKTGQPDFARLKITYIPNDLLVESKALKLYLFSYRNTGIFHEFVSNKIANDIFKATDAKFLQLQGDFLPRGGIAIRPVVNLGDLELAKQFNLV